MPLPYQILASLADEDLWKKRFAAKREVIRGMARAVRKMSGVKRCLRTQPNSAIQEPVVGLPPCRGHTPPIGTSPPPENPPSHADSIRPIMYNENVERSQWAKAHFFIAINECRYLVRKRPSPK